MEIEGLMSTSSCVQKRKLQRGGMMLLVNWSCSLKRSLLYNKCLMINLVCAELNLCSKGAVLIELCWHESGAREVSPISFHLYPTVYLIISWVGFFGWVYFLVFAFFSFFLFPGGFSFLIVICALLYGVFCSWQLALEGSVVRKVRKWDTSAGLFIFPSSLRTEWREFGAESLSS